MTNDSKKFVEDYFNRVNELKENGLDWLHAGGIADLEQKINNWPEKWGDNFVVIIYGDFEPLSEELVIDSLGISISPEVLKNTVIKNVRTAHRATIKIDSKSIDSVIDAIRRINVFLGTYVLVTWGNCFCNWWSHITHGTGGGVLTKLPQEDLGRAIDGVLSMKPELRKKVDSALYWLREPKNSMFISYRLDLLRIYAAYWNAFECLVDAIIIIKPIEKMTKVKKQELLDKLYEENGKIINVKFIQDAYTTIVNPGLKSKSEHALNICFGDTANHYMNECFNLEDENNRLYNIRNAINHGEVDAENPKEHARIQSRMRKLQIMVLGMIGRLIPYPYPVDRVNG